MMHICFRKRRKTRFRMRRLRCQWTRPVALLLACVALWMFALPAAMAEAGDEYTVTTAGDTLNIRGNPWVGADVIGKLWPGDRVTLVSEGDGWALVTADIEAGQGYVKSDYLTLTDASSPLGTYRNRSDGRVRVRTEPNGKRVRWLEAGDTVDVKRWTDADGERWGFVGDGYVLESCLEEVVP